MAAQNTSKILTTICFGDSSMVIPLTCPVQPRVLTAVAWPQRPLAVTRRQGRTLCQKPKIPRKVFKNEDMTLRRPLLSCLPCLPHCKAGKAEHMHFPKKSFWLTYLYLIINLHTQNLKMSTQKVLHEFHTKLLIKSMNKARHSNTCL